MFGEMDAMGRAIIHAIDGHFADIKSDLEQVKKDHSADIEQLRKTQQRDLNRLHELNWLEGEQMETLMYANIASLQDSRSAIYEAARLIKQHDQAEDHEGHGFDEPSTTSDHHASPKLQAKGRKAEEDLQNSPKQVSPSIALTVKNDNAVQAFQSLCWMLSISSQ